MLPSRRETRKREKGYASYRTARQDEGSPVEECATLYTAHSSIGSGFNRKALPNLGHDKVADPSSNLICSQPMPSSVGTYVPGGTCFFTLVKSPCSLRKDVLVCTDIVSKPLRSKHSGIVIWNCTQSHTCVNGWTPALESEVCSRLIDKLRVGR